jgi:hypothetical protein
LVTFGSYPLAHVSDVAIQESRIISDRLIPGAKIGHRRDQTAGGRTITVTGQIRDDPDYVLRLEEFRVRQDDVIRSLDLEDGSTAIDAKLGSIEAVWTVEEGVDRPSYSVTFYETC